MTCPMTVRLGVYALGAADAPERMLVESHLATCPECRAELALLEPLPGLLGRVPVSLLAGDRPPARQPAQAGAARPSALAGQSARARGGSRPNPRRPASRWRAVLGAAAAAVAGAAGGFWLAQPAASPPPAAITLSGANPATHTRVTVTLTGTSWGTSIRLIARGLPLNEPCRLIVRSRAGGTEVTGAWDAWRPGPVSIPASAAWRPADIASLQVATTSRSLVTITTGRPAPRPLASSHANGPAR
jgi:Putative zinc-finger